MYSTCELDQMMNIYEIVSKIKKKNLKCKTKMSLVFTQCVKPSTLSLCVVSFMYVINEHYIPKHTSMNICN